MVFGCANSGSLAVSWCIALLIIVVELDFSLFSDVLEVLLLEVVVGGGGGEHCLLLYEVELRWLRTLVFTSYFKEITGALAPPSRPPRSCCWLGTVLAADFVLSCEHIYLNSFSDLYKWAWPTIFLFSPVSESRSPS